MTLNEIEKFYQLGNVEGVAFIDPDGVMVEDQLFLSSGGAQAVAGSLFGIELGLKSSGRSCQTFLLKFDRYQFVSISTPSGLLILQLNFKQPVDATIEHALSLVQFNSSAAS